MIEPRDSAETLGVTPSLRPASANSSSQPYASSGDRPSDVASSQPVLEQQLRDLKQEIAALQESRDRLIQEQAQGVQAAVTRLVEEGLVELEQRRKTLQTAVEQLERRQERIRAEMRKSFAGVSQDLAVRVQGFKEYLVGSLQDLATTAEQLDLTPSSTANQPPVGPPQAMGQSESSVQPLTRSPRPAPSAEMPPLKREQSPERRAASPRASLDRSPRASAKTSPQALRVVSEERSTNEPEGAIKQPFSGHTGHIRQLLDQYQAMPDYYGRPWQLRRTFEPVHAERAAQWFFDLGGRGAIKTMGSRLQNVLIASATISALRDIHGDRVRALILGDSPERLGEWRRGLQDCLGISRTDFGAQRGVVLFEAPEAVAQRAERLVEQGQMPLILIDEGEDKVSLSLLQFPLWLAFAPDPADPLSLY
ncbi:MAG: DUF3086 domain-containing protein [Elainellaceae cyanobacterium]